MHAPPDPQNARRASSAKPAPKSHQEESFSNQESATPPTDFQTKKRGGKASRQKGDRAERAIVKFLQDQGFAAERIPLSGSAGGSFKGDITDPVLNVDRVVEVKCRADGFRELYRWLTDRDILIVKADRSEPLVIVPLRLAAEIAATAEGNSK